MQLFYSGSERAVMVGIVTGRRARALLSWRWIKDVKDILGIKMHGTGKMAKHQESFWWAVVREMFCNFSTLLQNCLHDFVQRA